MYEAERGGVSMTTKYRESILVISPGYPSEENPYNNSFVHQRVKGYMERGLNVRVFSVLGNPYKRSRKATGGRLYHFQDVAVMEGNHEDLSVYLRAQKHDKVLIHFAWKSIMDVVLEEVGKVPLLIWVHGVEALSWKRRVFNLSFRLEEILKFLGYIPLNILQLKFMKKLVQRQKEASTTFIFVSEWMKEIFQEDAKLEGNLANYRVIPNVINDQLFPYEEKPQEFRYEIFNVRPYHSRKYANDLMVKTILKLKNHDDFDKMTFHLFGAGRLFHQTVAPIKGLINVKIENRMLSQKEMAEIHRRCGVLLMPTRQDAQGVSMCEAMSSGLVPVVSKNTAIPEFVKEDFGYLCTSPEEMAQAILDLQKEPIAFQEKSYKASAFIRGLCAADVVLEKEMALINAKGL